MKTVDVTSLSLNSVKFDDVGRAIIDDEMLLEALAGGAGVGGIAPADVNGCGCGQGGTCNGYGCN